MVGHWRGDGQDNGEVPCVWRQRGDGAGRQVTGNPDLVLCTLAKAGNCLENLKVAHISKL